MKNKIDGKIYKITNKLNLKSYIGQTIQPLNNRISAHIKGNKSFVSAIHSAIIKYGVENFDICIIDNADNHIDLNNLEAMWVEKLDTMFPNGYNLKVGGNQPVISEATRKKLSDSHKGHIHTEEHRKKIGEKRKNHPVSEKTRNQIRNKLKNHPVSEEARTKISLAHKGKKLSEETRRKMSESRKGKKLNIKKRRQPNKPISEETRQRLSLSHIGVKYTDERKLKQSESFKKLKYFYNKDNDVEIRINLEVTKIPEGFLAGRRPMSINTCNKLKHRKRCRNLKTGVRFFLSLSDQLPENCVYGWS